jgi:hypothetical protein
MKAPLRIAVLALLTALIAAPAVAGDAFSLDLGVHGGVANSQSGKSGLFLGGAQVRLHLVWLLAAEVRGSYYSDSYKISEVAGIDVKNVPVQASAMLYPIKLPGFGIYLLGGGTYNAVTVDGTGTLSAYESTSQKKWCAHAGAGVDFKFGSFILNVDGRYVFLNVDPNNLPPATSGNYKGDYWTGTVGLLWKAF